MSWVKVSDEKASTGATFSTYRCDCCPRRLTTCGSPPNTPCVCSPAMSPKKRNTSGLKNRK